MLWHASAINGYAIEASDGDIGTVSDFLFDDASWLVRWLVVDTGNWLSGRKVLLPPSALGRLYANDRVFAVRLTKQQIKDSPEIDTDRPVSRQMETSVYDYYGWSPYWGSGLYMGGYGYMPGSGMASPYLGARRREQRSPKPRQNATMCICAASKRSPGTISMPATARSAMSRTSSSMTPIGASTISSSTRRTGGPGKRFWSRHDRRERSTGPIGW